MTDDADGVTDAESSAGIDGKKGRERSDGRSQILLYMKPNLIRDLKAEALEDGVTAFSLVEKAVIEFLNKRRRRKSAGRV